MSSFFTLPASQRKRKRVEPASETPAARGKSASRKQTRDESISGSEDSDDDAPAGAEDFSESEDEELRNEDPAAKRIRLAEQYLANTQKEILDDGGFDAADVDKENLRQRMGERLQEDTAESKGKLYRLIAEDLDWSRAETARFKSDTKCVTGVAVSGRYVYTVTQDRALIKWELPVPDDTIGEDSSHRKTSKKPKKLLFTRGNKRSEDHHSKAIICVAASQDGKFVATGGVDNKLIIWDPATLKPLKIFTGFLRDNGHRDSVLSLAFRRGTNQLFSASKDRTVKIWSLDELAYVETLFGHQDEVVDVSSLAQEICVSVGARDRTGRFWKVVEESQLVFRGGGAGGTKFKGSRGADRDSGIETTPEDKPYNEGSMDRVACIDDDTFITGSDNGALSLWNIHKKKAVFTYPLAHGLEPPRPLTERSAEVDLTQTLDAEGPMPNDPRPRWITALKAIPFSDVFVTGSWDGQVRAWRITPDKRRIEPLGPLSASATDAADDSVKAALEDAGIAHTDLDHQALQSIKRGAGVASRPVDGVVNDLAIVDKDERGKGGVYVVAAVGKEHRLGRWQTFEGKNCAVLFEVPKKLLGGAEVAGQKDGASADFD